MGGVIAHPLSELIRRHKSGEPVAPRSEATANGDFPPGALQLLAADPAGRPRADLRVEIAG